MNKQLTREEKETLALLLSEKIRRQQQKRFYRMFPDEDGFDLDGNKVYARHKYPKHIEFFEAGAKYRERCMMAANRCITPWTFVETDQGPMRAAEAWTSTGVRVRSQDGALPTMRPVSGGTLLGIEPAFRVVLDNGQFFDSNHRHLVSTGEGWLSLDQLVSLSSGLRSWHRPEDYEASCVEGGYLDDLQLLLAQDSGQVRLPSLGGAQQPGLRLRWPGDAEEPISQYTHASQGRDRLSSPDDLRRYEALFAHFARPASSQPFRPQTVSSQVLQQLAIEVGARLQEGDAFSLDRSSSVHSASGLREYLSGEGRQIALRLAGSGARLSLDAQLPGGSVQEFHRGEQGTAIFYPWVHPSLTGGRKIVAIVPLGLQPIIDAHVPITNCYWAGGVLHHNTGKTYGCGAFETTCHLTGLYPEWWPGRRFTQPVRWWAAGKTNETTRDIVQATLMGEVMSSGSRKIVSGTGMVPGALLGQITWKQGVSDLIDTVKVRHVSGRWSLLGFKSYQQGRGSFEGTAQHGAWLDEEPPLDVYGECLIRTATTNGIIMLTFTPLEGLSDTVMQFLPKPK